MTRKSLVAILVIAWCGVISAQTTAPSTGPATTASTRPAPRTAADAITPITRVQNPKQWIARHEGFMKQITDGGAFDLLFIGDSITDFFPKRAAEIWKRFEKYKPANFGLSGDRTEHVLWRITNGELEGISPKLVVIMIGTNNIGHFKDEKPEWAAAGVNKIVGIVREKLPESRILLLGVFPQMKDSDDRRRVIVLNKIISTLDDGQKIYYLDIGDKFLDDNGEIPIAIMPDKLHPTTRGYEIWYDAMIDKLDGLMKS